MRVDVRLQIAEIRLEAVEIDDRDRRLDLAERAADLAAEQLECPLGSRADGGGAHGPER